MNKLRLAKLMIICIFATINLNGCATQAKAIPKTEQQWEAKYPQVFSNVGYAKLIESAPEINQYSKLPESLQELSGMITNKFGIHDDILDFIIKKSAESTDERIFRAAILYEQYQQRICYGNVTQEKAVKLTSDDSILFGCLYDYTGSFEMTRGIGEYRAREDHMRYTDHKYFSWQALGSRFINRREKSNL